MNHYRKQTQQSFADHRALWVTLCTWTASFQSGRHIFSSHLMLCFTLHVFGRGQKDGSRGRSRRPFWNHKGMFERLLSKRCFKWMRSQGWILPTSGEVPGRARDTYVLRIHCRCNNGPQPVIQELYMQNAAPMFSHGSFVLFWGWGQPITVLWLHGIRQHVRVSGSRLQSRCCQNKSARRLHLIPPVPLCLRHISVFVGRNITACLCAHFLNCIKRMTHSATLFKLTLIASEWCAWEAGADGTMWTCN